MTEASWQGDVPGVQLRVRQRLSASPEEVWKWLVDPARAARWLAPRVTMIRQGKGFETRGLEDVQGRELVELAETEEMLPGRRWVLALRRSQPDWPAATRLTLELSRGVAVCELSIRQQGFQHLALSECLTIWELYRKRWRQAAERLAELVLSESVA